VRELKGFGHVALAPGESKRVTFVVDVSHMAFYDMDMNYVVEPGVIKVYVGRSATDVRLEDGFEIVGATRPVEEKVFFTKTRIE
jgi:beta-glucosidase